MPVLLSVFPTVVAPPASLLVWAVTLWWAAFAAVLLAIAIYVLRASAPTGRPLRLLLRFGRWSTLLLDTTRLPATSRAQSELHCSRAGTCGK